MGAWPGVGFLPTGVGGVAGSGLEKRECPVGVRDGLVLGGLVGTQIGEAGFTYRIIES